MGARERAGAVNWAPQHLDVSLGSFQAQVGVTICVMRTPNPAHWDPRGARGFPRTLDTEGADGSTDAGTLRTQEDDPA